MVIYLDQYRNVTATAPRTPRYGEDIMNASWTPELDAVAAAMNPQVHAPELPEDLSLIDVDEFMGRIYALASHV
ncbi:MAG: hypothetical protein ACREUW_09225 [Burkholderiales bacterium]